MSEKLQYDAYLRIDMYKELITSPIWPLIPAAWAELEHYGYNPPRNAYPHPDAGVLVMQDLKKDRIAGFLVYKPNEQSEYYIQLSYTIKDYRRQGIHSKLFEALIVRAEINDIVAIMSGTAIDNIPAQKAFEKQGRHAYSISYQYIVKPYAKHYHPNHKEGI